MNYTQRLLVIASLVLIGLVLAFVFLEMGDQLTTHTYPDTTVKIVGIYDVERPGRVSGVYTSHYGIYSRQGVVGVLLGLVVPLCLFAGAAFVALGTKARGS